MDWTTLRGHAGPIEMLRRTTARGRLSHTYLFVGPAGVGKKRFARGLAQCVLCERFDGEHLEACGRCHGCQQVLAGTHPDLLTVACPEGKSELPIELFLGPPERRGKAGLCYELSLKPMSAGRKVAIIDDADCLNEASANALLKTLEEPPPHSILMLIATTPDALLVTIRSRCQIVRFDPLPAEDLRQILLDEGMTESPDEAADVAQLCGGSLQTAAQLLDPQLRAQRNGLYDLLAAPTFNSVQTAARVIEGLESAGTETSAQRQFAGWVIRFCMEFYRQAMLHLAGGEASASNIPQVQRFVERFPERSPDDIEQVAELLERCLLAERQLDSKAAVPLCMEALFDDLGQISRRRAAVR